jgi:hypothetical protein
MSSTAQLLRSTASLLAVHHPLTNLCPSRWRIHYVERVANNRLEASQIDNASCEAPSHVCWVDYLLRVHAGEGYWSTIMSWGASRISN